MEPEEELKLVQRAAAGDQAARRALIPEALIEALFSYASYHLNSSQDAEDLVEEALVSVLGKLAGFRGASSFRTWVQGFVDNKIRDYRRKRWLKFEPTPDAVLDRRPATVNIYRDPMLIALESEAVRQIQLAFWKLSPDEQTAFRELRCNGRSAAELAEELGRSVEAVESLRYRAVRKMRSNLHEYYAERRQRQTAAKPGKAGEH